MVISELNDVPEEQQFVLMVDGHKAFIDYEQIAGVYHLNHSQVPEGLRGQGVGNVLVERTFEHLTAAGYEVVAHCGFICAVARGNEQWRDVIRCA